MVSRRHGCREASFYLIVDVGLVYKRLVHAQHFSSSSTLAQSSNSSNTTQHFQISVTIAAIAAVALASSADAFRVCKSGWEDENTCAYVCKNGDPIDGQWCRNFKSALNRNGANCWGDCNAGNGFQFWCSKSTLSPSDCPSHFWNN
ncbi:hypothetical protein BGZ70_008390 [Mortierella alpina]|uniref:Uncharacterized protein n=1 Tax=Mortierella alpina TaxID=64518 RepID=A0A9P6M6R8_MORAP|nr:hypothetical protein BGZ70_008390 [Mortierella alpina]